MVLSLEVSTGKLFLEMYDRFLSDRRPNRFLETLVLLKKNSKLNKKSKKK